MSGKLDWEILLSIKCFEKDFSEFNNLFSSCKFR